MPGPTPSNEAGSTQKIKRLVLIKPRKLIVRRYPRLVISCAGFLRPGHRKNNVFFRHLSTVTGPAKSKPVCKSENSTAGDAVYRPGACERASPPKVPLSRRLRRPRAQWATSSALGPSWLDGDRPWPVQLAGRAFYGHRRSRRARLGQLCFRELDHRVVARVGYP
jgi:hypothetical protein